jgi:hypothetical protein
LSWRFCCLVAENDCVVPYEHAEAIKAQLYAWNDWSEMSKHLYPPLRPKHETDAIVSEYVELSPPPLFAVTDHEQWKRSPPNSDWHRYHKPPPPEVLTELAGTLMRWPLFFRGGMICRREVVEFLRPHLDRLIFHIMERKVPAGI